MSDVAIPREQWKEFLDEFSERHRGWLVRLEIHDRDTEEEVGSHYLPLHSIELDTEDAHNPRINVSVDSDHKLIKHVLFRPSRLMLGLTSIGADESLLIESLNTTTTVRFRAAVFPEIVDGVA
jgi:hypothetical protein